MWTRLASSRLMSFWLASPVVFFLNICLVFYASVDIHYSGFMIEDRNLVLDSYETNILCKLVL